MKDLKNYVYIIQELQSGDLKVGISKTPKKRLGQLQIANPRKLMITHQLEGTVETEQEIQRILRPYKLRGEWFRPSDEFLQNIIKDFKFETLVKYVRHKPVPIITKEDLYTETGTDTYITKTLSFRIEEPLWISFRNLCNANNITIKEYFSTIVNMVLEAKKQEELEVGEKLLEIVKNDKNRENLLDVQKT